MRLLTELLTAVSGEVECTGAPATRIITSITRDSRSVIPGALFVAVKGEKSDGVDFIPGAKQSGAIAVLCDAQATFDEVGLIVIRARDVRMAAAKIAAAFYGAQPEHMVAVTGTDGKTSTCDFFRQLWHGIGKSSASIGTLGVIGGDGKMLTQGVLTTPPPEKLHALLAALHDKRVEYAAMEASSHGIDQRRLDGVLLEAAAFTNIARDHLDYHKTEEAYFIAKARLFAELLPEGGTAVLNADDKRFTVLREMCKKREHRVMAFGKNGVELRLNTLTPLAHGQRAQCTLFGKEYTLEVPLVGAFQVMNILAALGLVVATGGALEAALAVVPKLRGVPGRLELAAQLKNGASVFVDYAHTPAALENILRTLRPHTSGKLHVVFGCGGDRDKGKRPEMGRIAAQLADHVIVTDDNPRSEEAATIRAEIMAACPGATEIGERGRAIAAGVAALRDGDILVLAGKGHEKTQIIGEQLLPFDDIQVARDAVKVLR